MIREVVKVMRISHLVLIRLTPQAPRDSVGRDAPGVSSFITRV